MISRKFGKFYLCFFILLFFSISLLLLSVFKCLFTHGKATHYYNTYKCSSDKAKYISHIYTPDYIFSNTFYCLYFAHFIFVNSEKFAFLISIGTIKKFIVTNFSTVYISNKNKTDTVKTVSVFKSYRSFTFSGHNFLFFMNE